jgi:hypothetical protein
MDEGRFSISMGMTHQRIGAWQRDRTDDRRVIACTLRGLGAVFGAGLLLHLVGAAR